jgi:hypothetical protein
MRKPIPSGVGFFIGYLTCVLLEFMKTSPQRLFATDSFLQRSNRWNALAGLVSVQANLAPARLSLTYGQAAGAKVGHYQAPNEKAHPVRGGFFLGYLS